MEEFRVRQGLSGAELTGLSKVLDNATADREDEKETVGKISAILQDYL